MHTPDHRTSCNTKDALTARVLVVREELHEALLTGRNRCGVLIDDLKVDGHTRLRVERAHFPRIRSANADFLAQRMSALAIRERERDRFFDVQCRLRQLVSSC